MRLRKILQGANKKVFQRLRIFFRKKFKFIPPLTIISSDCSGGVLLHDYGLALDTPTVNMIITGDDFLRLCENLEEYLSKELVEVDGGDHAVALCADVKLDAIHYRTFEQLNSAWRRRSARVHFDNIVFLFSENQIENEEQLDRFAKLKGRKLVLASEGYSHKYPFINHIRSYNNGQFFFMGISGKRRYEKDFDLYRWLKEKEK